MRSAGFFVVRHGAVFFVNSGLLPVRLAVAMINGKREPRRSLEIRRSGSAKPGTGIGAVL